jgi:hypothetical protein
VNVENRGGCCNNGWDNDYHPIATAAAVTAAVAVTSASWDRWCTACPPAASRSTMAGMIYQQCGGTLGISPRGPQYIVVTPPY